MTALDLDAIKARAAAATAGPWTADGEQISAQGEEQWRFKSDGGPYRPTIDIGGGNWGGEGGGYYMDTADAEFIAHARTDVPALVGEVERLRETLVEIQAMHHAKHGIYSHVDSGTGAHLGDEPYVICDYDKTPWPCRTQLVLTPKSSDLGSAGSQS